MTRITDIKRIDAFDELARIGADFGRGFLLLGEAGDDESRFTKNACIFRKGTDVGGCRTDCMVAGGQSPRDRKVDLRDLGTSRSPKRRVQLCCVEKRLSD